MEYSTHFVTKKWYDELLTICVKDKIIYTVDSNSIDTRRWYKKYNCIFTRVDFPNTDEKLVVASD